MVQPGNRKLSRALLTSVAIIGVYAIYEHSKYGYATANWLTSMDDEIGKARALQD